MHRTDYSLSESTKQKWTHTRHLMNETLDGVFQACIDLGFINLTRDSLRIADGGTPTNVQIAISILIMHFWDDGPTAQSAIHAWACPAISSPWSRATRTD